MSRLTGPLKYSGTLDSFENFDITTVIGREFPNLQLSDILHDDDKIRDLGILVSQRGVIFFRNQNLNIDQQKTLAQKLGELTGKPKSSRLHRHPFQNSQRGIPIDENGRLDDEVTVISSEQRRSLYQEKEGSSSHRKFAGVGWHSDISTECIPSDYSLLKMIQLPDDAGGDTLWASGYEAYDRLSPPFQALAESITATHFLPIYREISQEHGADLISDNRGSPENRDLTFQAEHPVIRTNPVTGWKSLFGAGLQVASGWYNGVSEQESDALKSYFNRVIYENHDLQVRFRWNINDVAIWDNRSAFHTATNDYRGKRQGILVVSVGEKPYFDPGSVSRHEELESMQRSY